MENESIELSMCSRTPKRDALIEFLKLSQCATLEEIQSEIQNIFNK